MRFGRLEADDQLACDLAIAQATRHEGSDFGFALRQGITQRGDRNLGDRRDELVQQLPRLDQGGLQCFALCVHPELRVHMLANTSLGKPQIAPDTRLFAWQRRCAECGTQLLRRGSKPDRRRRIGLEHQKGQCFEQMGEAQLATVECSDLQGFSKYGGSELPISAPECHGTAQGERLEQARLIFYRALGRNRLLQQPVCRGVVASLFGEQGARQQQATDPEWRFGSTVCQPVS